MFQVFLESEAQMEATGPVVKYAEVKHKLIYEVHIRISLNTIPLKFKKILFHNF